MNAWKSIHAALEQVVVSARHDVVIHLSLCIRVVIMKNHESFMNLVEQVSLSDGDQTGRMFLIKRKSNPSREAWEGR